MPICMKTKLQKKALVNGPFGFFKKFHFSVIKVAIVRKTHMVLKHLDEISFWNNENCQFMHLFQYKQVYLIELHMNFQRIYPSLRRWYIYYIKVDNTFRIKFLQKTESLHVYHTSWQSCFFTIVKTIGVHSVPITKIAQKTKQKSEILKNAFFSY